MLNEVMEEKVDEELSQSTEIKPGLIANNIEMVNVHSNRPLPNKIPMSDNPDINPTRL